MAFHGRPRDQVSQSGFVHTVSWVAFAPPLLPRSWVVGISEIPTPARSAPRNLRYSNDMVDTAPAALNALDRERASPEGLAQGFA